MGSGYGSPPSPRPGLRPKMVGPARCCSTRHRIDRYGPMYKVLFRPTEESPRKEEWFEADTVHESPSGGFWDFVDRNGRVVRRLSKSRVASYCLAVDRRKYPQIDLTDAQVDRRVSASAGREPRRATVRGTYILRSY